MIRTVLLWGQLLSGSTGVSYPDNALLAPDFEEASLGSPGASIEVADFSGGLYGDLPRLLGLDAAQLPPGSLVAFEDNGGHAAGGGGWESSHWTFSDGVRSYTIAFDETAGAVNPPAVVATGSLSAEEYAAFFGLDAADAGGEVYSFLVFRMPPRLDVGSAEFTVTVTEGMDIDGEGTPDPEAIAIVGGMIRGR